LFNCHEQLTATTMSTVMNFRVVLRGGECVTD
jgi:hypothetical protein